jgi:hypothetical protein
VVTRILIQTAAGLLLLGVLWRAFRFAMGLRAARLFREEERQAFADRGQRVVAELPLASGDLALFVDAGDAFLFRERSVRKADIRGARMLLNGAVMASVSRPGARLPDPPRAEEYEGRERWDVLIYLSEGTVEVPCGTVREGISRDSARRVHEAVTGAVVSEITPRLESA